MIHTSEVILAMRRFIKDNQMVIIGITLFSCAFRFGGF
jgi:hypothetical protein